MSKLVSYYGDYDKPVPPHAGGQAMTMTCDLAVIGGGGAGLSAAVRAAELGVSVVLIEKMTELGGNTRLAAGLLCTNSSILKEKGVPDTTEEHINLYRRSHGYRLDPAIYERFIRTTGPYYDWLAAKGLDTGNKRVVMDKIVMVRDRKVWEPLRNPAYGPGLIGNEATDVLTRQAEESENIKLLLSTQVTAITADEFGAVTGVRAVGGGFDWTIRADHVIIASGGFGCDNELLKKYFPQYFSSDNYFTHYCLNHCTGDGIRLAEAVGAKTGENMSIGLEAMKHMPGAYTLQRITAQPEGVLVGANGRRFIAEDDMDNGEFAMDALPEGLAWYIFTQQTASKLYDLALQTVRFGDWMPEESQLYLDIEEELSQGLVVQGGTIEELAAAIGAPGAVLRQTLEEYESFCAQGCDRRFGKDPAHLMSLGLEGPWYGVRLVRKFDVTMGGVSIDSRLRALRPDGSAVQGLYACGDIASNWMGEEYGPMFSSLAWALTSGYLAGEEAAASLGAECSQQSRQEINHRKKEQTV